MLTPAVPHFPSLLAGDHHHGPAYIAGKLECWCAYACAYYHDDSTLPLPLFGSLFEFVHYCADDELFVMQGEDHILWDIRIPSELPYQCLQGLLTKVLSVALGITIQCRLEAIQIPSQVERCFLRLPSIPPQGCLR